MCKNALKRHLSWRLISALSEAIRFQPDQAFFLSPESMTLAQLRLDLLEL